MIHDYENWTYDDENKILRIKRVEEIHKSMFIPFDTVFGKFCNEIEYKVIIPDSVKLIDSACFLHMSAKEYVFPNSINEIGSYVFANNAYLKVIQWPDSVKSISEHAFEDCNSLKEIVLPEGIEEICNYAFQRCKSLNTISIPSTVSKVDLGAFGYCDMLREISFSDSIRWIGSQAFEYCTHLERIQLPEGLQSIGNYTFVDCFSLKTIFIPTTVETLGENAFCLCQNLKEIYVPRALYGKYGGDNYFKSNTSAEVIPYDEPMNISTNTIAKPEIITTNTIETTATPKREFKSFNGVIRTNLIANKKKK